MQKLAYLLFTFFVVFPSISKASTVKTWIDGNKLEWTMLEVQTTYRRARNRCDAMGFRMPAAEDFFEAIDYGLLSPDKNPEFGNEADKIDWIWIRTQNAGLHYGNMASKQGDTAVDYAETRHWAFCVRPHIN